MDGKVFTQIMIGIIMIIGALVSYYVIPWLKTLVTDQQMDQVVYYINLAVKCAEQIYSVEEWMQKKAYVIGVVRAFLEEHKITVTEEQINVIIEAMVHEVKKEREKNEYDPRLQEQIF